MITNLSVPQLKSLIYLKNVHTEHYNNIQDIITMLIEQNVEALKSAVNTQEMFKSQGAIYTLEELLALLDDPKTTLARIEQ